jgi:hypothetical protein
MSTNAPWSDILRVEKLRVRAGERVELCPKEHQIALRLGPSASVEVPIADERPRRIVARPGDLCFSAQGVPVRPLPLLPHRPILATTPTEKKHDNTN